MIVSRLFLRSVFCSRLLCALVVALLLILSRSLCQAQSLLPLSGTHFTFAVIEGPDNIGGDAVASTLLLSIVSNHAGDGIILSPSGYQQRFTFDANSVTAIDLDYNLMLLTDVGQSEKGLVLMTSQPVTANLHDYALEAGDATQLLPDEALDTSYIIAAWGIYNDVLAQGTGRENNHSQFVVTAAWDNTVVTITPTINALGGLLANVPFTITLNRGECYIVKADFNGRQANTSLVESRVSSTKPVSVIVGLTCAYNPLAIESCNEIMDELIPRSAWGTEFNAVPLAPNGDEDILFFTSDVLSYTLQVNGGLTYFASNGHLEVPIQGPVNITTTVPVQCHELSEGSWFDPNGESDPSMVTVLPIGQYHDTLLWTTPSYRFDANYLTAVIPTSAIPQVQIDGIPLATLAMIAPLSQTMSAVSVQVDSGRHILTSPVPVFGIADGFAQADAYTYLTGTVTDSVPHFLTSSARFIRDDSEIYCREFSLDVGSNLAELDTNNSLQTITFSITYDGSKLQLHSLIPYPVLRNEVVTIDTSSVGIIHLTINAPNPLLPSIRDNGPFFRVRFLSIDPTAAPTVVNNAYSYNSIFPDLPPVAGIDTINVTPLIIVDTSYVAMSVNAGSVTLGTVDTATINLGAVGPTLGVKSFVLRFKYDHDILTYRSALLAGTLTNGWTVSKLDSIDRETDQLTFTSSGDTLVGSGILVQLLFNSFVSDSATAFLQVSSIFTTSTFCPQVLVASRVSGLFYGQDICGDQEFHRTLGVNGLVINSIIPNPSSGTFNLSVNSGLVEDASISLVDMLGRTVWKSDAYHLVRGPQPIICNAQALSEGSYILRIATPTGASSRMVVVQK